MVRGVCGASTAQVITNMVMFGNVHLAGKAEIEAACQAQWCHPPGLVGREARCAIFERAAKCWRATGA